MKIGIIGGSGFEKISGAEYKEDISLTTDYGAPSSKYKHFKLNDINFYLLNRHGDAHDIAPHKINYRANVKGFKELGVDAVVAFSAVGGINRELATGSMVLLDNALDFTSGRSATFFEDKEIYHIDLTYPFCAQIGATLKKSADDIRLNLVEKGVSVCTNGPRLETASEIKMYAALGADVVGMTLFPEVALFREAEICFANVSTVTNPAAGVIANHKLTSDEVIENARKVTENITKLIESFSKNIKKERSCGCRQALKGAKI